MSYAKAYVNDVLDKGVSKLPVMIELEKDTSLVNIDEIMKEFNEKGYVTYVTDLSGIVKMQLNKY